MDSRGSEGAVGLVRRFRGYRDLDLTLHAALSLEQGLGSTVPSTAAGNPCPVLSRTAWRRCDSRPVSHSAVLCRLAADVAGVVGRVGWM